MVVVEEKKKDKVLQIRLSELEKQVIKEKAEILGYTITDYIKYCCIFSNTTKIFMENMTNKDAFNNMNLSSVNEN